MMPHYSMIIVWSEEDNCYLVHIPDFPFQQFHTHGNTYEEAAKHGEEVIDSYLEIYQAEGRPVPESKHSLQILQAA